MAERGLALAKLWMERLEARLEGREWVAIDRISIADITTYVSLDFAKWVKLRAGDEHPNIQAFHARMKARPSSSA